MGGAGASPVVMPSGTLGDQIARRPLPVEADRSLPR